MCRDAGGLRANLEIGVEWMFLVAVHVDLLEQVEGWLKAVAGTDVFQRVEDLGAIGPRLLLRNKKQIMVMIIMKMMMMMTMMMIQKRI